MNAFGVGARGVLASLLRADAKLVRKITCRHGYRFDPAHDLRQNRGSFMSEHDLRVQIKEMLVKNLMLQVTPEQIGDDLPLFGPEGLGLDSIDALELVVSMEKTFGVGVPSSDVAGKALRTVNTIHDYILEKRGATA